jgi:tetratricopeptide (TPR) repeat protein
MNEWQLKKMGTSLGILVRRFEENSFMTIRVKSRIAVLMFLSVGILSAFGFISDIRAEEDFSKRYQAYQQAVSSGKASLNKKDYEAAIEYYTWAIEMSPFVASHYYDRGIAWYKKGDEKKAIEDFDKVLILEPRSGSAYVYRGLCKVKGGDYQGALNDYRKGLELNPKDPSIHNNLAWLYATAKDEKFQDKLKALEHAARAAELSHENNAEILDTLARVYFINGKINEAIETEKKALKLEPNNERFKENLKEYEKAMKKD